MFAVTDCSWGKQSERDWRMRVIDFSFILHNNVGRINSKTTGRVNVARILGKM